MLDTEIGRIKDPVERFFAFMRERQSIYLKKEQGLERPWTNDPILSQYKFTNVYREQDKTTKWFRENVRERLRDDPSVFLATVLFRWFNRIEIGETIFSPKPYLNGTPFSVFLKTGDAKYLESEVRAAHPNGPWVTGAYLITSKKGMDKLAGMCSIASDFYHGRYPYKKEGNYSWSEWGSSLLRDPGQYELQHVWEWLKEVPFQGPFHAYEVVTDLRHTALLDRAPDINIWANAGPGAKRGLNRIYGRDKNEPLKQSNALNEMIGLLGVSKSNNMWPNNAQYPSLELREIEHSLCEFDKYMRVLNEEGQTRSLYR
jgi:hypothetical protein